MRIKLALLLALVSSTLFGQNELLDLLNATEDTGPNYATATFKSTRLINGHSIETRTQGVLEFVISHRFGRLNTGIDEFFGLDNANIRLGLEYAITDQLNVGVGRSSFQRTYDLFAKYKFFRQSNSFPITVTGFASAASQTTDFPEGDFSEINRWAYTYQGLIARKFNSSISFQVMPTLIHRNLVPTEEDATDFFAVGFGGRVKLNPRVAVNFEYFYQVSDHQSQFRNPIAIGFDIETGGHVFQLHLTNAQQMVERGFVAETTGDFFDGDIHFGFNISRVFNLGVKQREPN